MQNLLKPLLAVKTKQGYSIFTAVVVTLFSTWVMFDATKAEVVVAADGDLQTVKTHIKTVGELLEDLGIDIKEQDYLSHASNARIVDGMEIQYKKANKILLTVDDKTDEFFTTAETVGEFFNEEGIVFSEHDDLSHHAMSLLEENLEIVVNTAFQIEVLDGREKKNIWTTGGTIKDLLIANKIDYNEIDKIEPNLDEEVSKDTIVSIIRVEKRTEEIEENIPFEKEEKEDSSMEKGTSRVVQKGEEGKIVKTYEVTLENGKEVERVEIDQQIKEEPKKEIVAVGTKEVKKATTSKQNNANTSAPETGGKVFTMVATAYGPDCGGCSGITATGINIKQNPTPKIVSVDPSVIPLGSRVWVEGYGEAIAADTGGAIKGNRIDVLVPSESYAAKNWGRRTVTVKVLN